MSRRRKPWEAKGSEQEQQQAPAPRHCWTSTQTPWPLQTTTTKRGPCYYVLLRRAPKPKTTIGGKRKTQPGLASVTPAPSRSPALRASNSDGGSRATTKSTERRSRESEASLATVTTDGEALPSQVHAPTPEPQNFYFSFSYLRIKLLLFFLPLKNPGLKYTFKWTLYLSVYKSTFDLMIVIGIS